MAGTGGARRSAKHVKSSILSSRSAALVSKASEVLRLPLSPPTYAVCVSGLDLTWCLLLQINDVFLHCPLPSELQKYQGAGGSSYTVQAHHAKDLLPSSLEWTFELCKRNMQAMYEEVWGWDEPKKKKQLTAVRLHNCPL